MVREGLKVVTAGAAPVGGQAWDVRGGRGRHRALAEQARDVEGRDEIAQVATISSQDATIGGLIADAFDKVGKDGVISVEESSTTSLEMEFTEGMQFDKGYLSPYFVTDAERMEAVLEDALVLLVQGKVAAIAEILPLLEKVMQAAKPLLIIAEDVEGEALSTLVVNKIKGTFNSAAVKAPAFGDRRKAILQDIAILTGAQVVTAEVGLKLDQVGLEVLGTARRVVITKDTTTIVDGGGAPGRRGRPGRSAPADIENTDSDWDREKLQERLAKLAGGVSVIKVGAHTEVELKEKKHRIEDAVSATRAAIEEGIVAGGGAALVHAALGALRRPGPHRRRAHRGQRRAQGTRRAAALDRRERRRAGLRGGREGPRGWAGPGPGRRVRAVRGPHRGGHHRPGQGDPLRAGERRLHRRACC